MCFGPNSLSFPIKFRGLLSQCELLRQLWARINFPTICLLWWGGDLFPTLYSNGSFSVGSYKGGIHWPLHTLTWVGRTRVCCAGPFGSGAMAYAPSHFLPLYSLPSDNTCS